MTPDAQAILAAARALPAHEQLEVLQGLAQSLARTYPPLEDISSTFWKQRSLDELARAAYLSSFQRAGASYAGLACR